MKIYRTIIALLLLAALVIPQAAPVQSAPLVTGSSENTISLQPGETVWVNCPTRLVRKFLSKTKLKLLCGRVFVKPKKGATPTPAATPTPIPDTAQTPSIKVSNLLPGDSITVTCPTILLRKFATPKKRNLLCRPSSAPSDSTATPTALPSQTSAPTETQPPSPTATQGDQNQTSTPISTQPTDPTATYTATVTSTPTATFTPSATATGGTSGAGQPFKGAPACPTHDVNKWHGLWDYQRGCHYDHTHGDDPSLADKYFGSLGAYWNGTTISYPFNSGPSENALKHPGYKISVRMPGYHPWPACGTEDNTDITGDHSDNCVIASRTEYHIVGGLMDIVSRYHSYWMEVYICKPPYRQPQDCGIMRTGGLLDYGQLQAPHYNARVVRPGGTIDFGNGITLSYSADGPDLPSRSGEPYVFGIPYSPETLDQYRRTRPKSPATIDQWSSNDFDCEPRPAGDPCHNQYTHVLFQVGDAFNLVDTQNLNKVRWICYGEPNCEYDGSLIGMNEIAVRVMQSWPTNNGGFVTFNGYSDKWGNPRFDNTCTSVSADCVPFILEHAPVGVAASRSDNKCECQVWEYDIYFDNKPSGWIKFPN